jgi:hypothetical protein
VKPEMVKDEYEQLAEIKRDGRNMEASRHNFG